MNNLTLSIIIPAFNEEKYISNCLNYIFNAQKLWFVLEIIVVDNNSNDNTAKIAKLFSNVKVISEKKQWTNFARQAWYLVSKWDLIAFIDADTQIPINRPKYVIDIFIKNSEIWTLVWWYSYYDANFLQNFYSKIVWYIWVPILREIIWYVGNWWNMIIKKSVLDKIWWFDTSLKFYWDDVNTARRASKIQKCVYKSKIIIPTSYRRFTWAWFLKTNISYIKAFFYEIIKKEAYNPKDEHFR